MKSPTKPDQQNHYLSKQREGGSPYKQYVYVPKNRNSGAPGTTYPEEKRKSYPPIANHHHQQHGLPDQQRNHRNSFPLPMVYPPKFIHYPMQFPPPVSPPRRPHPHGVNRPPHSHNGRPQHPPHPPHPHFHPDMHRARASSQPSPLHNVPQYPMVQPRRKSLTPTGPLGAPPGGSPKGMWGPPPPHHIAKISNVSMRPVAPFFYPGPPPPGMSLYFRPPPHGCFLQPAQPSAPPNSGETLTFVPRPFPVEETSPLKRNKTKVYSIGDLTLSELKAEFRAYAILNMVIKDNHSEERYAVINFAKVKELYRAFQVKHEQEIVVQRKNREGEMMDVTFRLKLEIIEQSLDPMFQLKQEEIERFPLIQFQGKTFVIETPEQIEGAVYALLKRDPTTIEIRDNVILGMDLEWRPVFNVGKYNRTALLQLSTGTVCVLFRINILRQEHDVDFPGEQYKLPLLVTQILENPFIRKVGCGLIGDCTRLKNDFGIECAGVDDIAELPIIKRCRPRSLQALTAIFLGGHMSKKQRVSDWERLPHLTRDQIIYAATDAWCGREVYIKMSQMPYSLVYS